MGAVGVEAARVVGERDHHREGVAESVEVVAHGDHVFLAGESSEVAVQDQHEWPAALVAEPPGSAFVIDEGDVGEELALADQNLAHWCTIESYARFTEMWVHQ